MDIENTIAEIKRLKNNPREHCRKIKLRHLKNDLLAILPFGKTEIGEDVFYKTDTPIPYLQIYTKESWERGQSFYKKNILPQPNDQ